MIFLTIIDKYQDNLGIWRWDNVSWPVFRLKPGDPLLWLVRDIDGTEFECAALNSIQSRVPSRLANMSLSDYQEYSRTADISDYNKFYKRFGVDQEANTRGTWKDGEFDVEAKKKIINERDYGKSETKPLLQRNLLIED